MVRFSALLATTIGTFALLAPAASAARIYYSCGADICRIAPDGSGQETVASGRQYRAPSVSLDGQHLAWIEPTADLFTGNGAGGDPVGPLTRFATTAILSADGSQVLVGETATPSFRICVYPAGGGSCASQAGGGTAGWGPDGRVLLTTYDFGDPAFTAHNRSYDNKVCLLKPDGGETGGECEQTFAYDADFQLADPALSPDGSTLAVERASWDAPDATQIALYDVASTGLKGVLTSGPGDITPRWSPDGSMLAFTRDGGIWVVRADGAPGSEQRLADGTSPSWSTVDGAAADSGGSGGSGDTGGARPVSAIALKKVQSGPTVRGKATIGTAGSRLAVDLIVKQGRQGTIVGRSVRAAVPAGRQPFRATLLPAVQRRLRKAGVHRVPLVVRIVVTAPGGAPQTVVKKVTLKLR